MATVVRECHTVSPFWRSHVFSTGATVAKYAGEYVHKRLIEGDTYREGRYQEALKRAFLDTDAEMKNSALYIVCAPTPGR